MRLDFFCYVFGPLQTSSSVLMKIHNSFSHILMMIFVEFGRLTDGTNYLEHSFGTSVCLCSYSISQSRVSSIMHKIIQLHVKSFG